MKKILVVAMAVALVNIGTANAEWVKVTSDNDVVPYYVDRESIKKSGNSISASILTNSIYSPTSKTASAVGIILVSCNNRTVHNERVTIYTQPMGRGDAVETKELDQTIKIGANSGTLSNRNEKDMATIFNFICR